MKNRTIFSDGRNTFFTHVRCLVSVGNQTTVMEENLVWKGSGASAAEERCATSSFGPIQTLIFRNSSLREIICIKL